MTSVGNRAVERKDLTTVKIPNSVTQVKQTAFASIKWIVSIYLHRFLY